MSIKLRGFVSFFLYITQFRELKRYEIYQQITWVLYNLTKIKVELQFLKCIYRVIHFIMIELRSEQITHRQME